MLKISEYVRTKIQTCYYYIRALLWEGSYKSYLVLLIFFGLIVAPITHIYKVWNGSFREGVIVESVGLLFDIFVLGLIFNYFSNKGNLQRERKMKIDTYTDEIDDFKGWEDEEAKHRILGMLKRLNRIGYESHKLNLKKCYLPNSNLKKINLSGANLEGAILEDSILQNADLHEAKLYWANLKGTDLKEANLKSANLKHTNLQEANLIGADLRGALLNGSDLRESNLSWAKLHLTELEGAYMPGVNLIGADLRGANLKGVNLSGASFGATPPIETQGLTLEQLKETKSLYGVKGLKPDLEVVLKSMKRELFVKPRGDRIEEVSKSTSQKTKISVSQCKGLTKSRQQCSLRTTDSSEYCWMHRDKS